MEIWLHSPIIANPSPSTGTTESQSQPQRKPAPYLCVAKPASSLEIATYPSSPSKSKQRSNHTVLSRTLSKHNLHAWSGPRLGPGFWRRGQQVAGEAPAPPPGQAVKLQPPFTWTPLLRDSREKGDPGTQIPAASLSRSAGAEWDPAGVAAGTVGAELGGRGERQATGRR